MKNDHYNAAKDGDWTYSDGVTHQTFVFRKGSLADPIRNSLQAAHRFTVQDRAHRDWLVATSEWGYTNPVLIEQLCNLLNREGFR